MVEEATEAQIKFANQLGIQNPASFSKAALRELIDMNLKQKNGSGNIGDGEQIVDAPIVQPGKTQPTSPKREFHLSPEQVRTNALNAAITHSEIKNVENTLKLAAIFEEYLWNGR